MMFRQALSEVRRHPGRFVSTLLAIAISVAFLGGSSILVATEGQAQGMAMNVWSASADVVVAPPSDGTVAGIGPAVARTPGVAASSPLLSGTVVVSAGANSQALQLLNVPPEPLRWAKLTAGVWPTQGSDIALSAPAARALNLTLGAELRLAGQPGQLRVVGITDEPSGLLAKTGYAADTYLMEAGIVPTAWTIKAAPGVSQARLVADLADAVSAVDPRIEVAPAAELRARAVSRLVTEFDAFAYVLWAFGAVALVVGMITIANTFSITLAQRRRQIGLLRAVGASGSQVRGRFLIEALLLGALGSALGLLLGAGLAAAGAVWSTALFWGFALPWAQLLLIFALGVSATMIAAFVPVWRGTRVLPLEALQPVPSSEELRRGSLTRAVVCGLLVVLGGGLAAVGTLRVDSRAMLWAIGGGALIAAGVLFGASLFVPALLRATGGVVRRFGTVARLAADNAERNPRRATATATALMLAIGLMVTLQVATASLQATVLDELETHYPVDLQVAWGLSEQETIPQETAARLARIPGVDASVLLASGTADLGELGSLTVLGYRDEIRGVTGVNDEVGADEVLVSPHLEDIAATVALTGSKGSVTLKVVRSRLVNMQQVMVSPETLARLGPVTPDAVMWLSVPDRTRAVSVWAATAEATGDPARVQGSIAEAALYEQVLSVLLAITTALLGVAVLIALIGVSNTLGLSVLERTRESALLRALGLQARSLRAMLTIEALQVTLVGVLVGVAAGAFFGWLAVTGAARSSGFERVIFAIDAPRTVGMIAVAMLAAAAASVLPGRRAAQAAPTEALADA